VERRPGKGQGRGRERPEAGDVVNASRTAVTDIMLTLKDADEITGTALGVVTDAIREPSGQQEVGVEAQQAARAVISGAVGPWARSAGRYQGRPGGRRAGLGDRRRGLTRRGRNSEEGLMSEVSLAGTS
jgi:hypothetical protein